MAEPHLPSLVIEGFRGFKKLELRKLGHVNLLVGKNGVGKSSVLDAVRLYASQFSVKVLNELLDERGDDWLGGDRNALQPLLYGRPAEVPEKASLRIGNQTVRFVWLIPTVGADGRFAYTEDADGNGNQALPGISIEENSRVLRQHAFRENGILTTFFDRDADHRAAPAITIGANGLADGEICKRWDETLQQGLEDTLTHQFRSIRNDATKLHMIQAGGGERHPYVVLNGLVRPVPLRALGDGLARFLGITISVALASRGFLLIDEFENGLHHSVQEKLWSFVFKVAREMNVQVFATTHSEDCVRAFAIAANKDTASLGVMPKLVEHNGQIVAKQLMEEDVLAGAQGLVEMR